jgi:hypothetical protein
MQTKVMKPAESVTSQKEEVAEKFDALRSTKTTRTVRLTYKSCCGCGCQDITINRKVSSDSKLKNGDRVYEVEDNDWVE